jgi:hypothetical protein
MKLQILFKDEFKAWLIDSKICTPESASSYASYISGVNNTFDIDGYSLCELIEKFHIDGKPSKINEIITGLVEDLYLIDICERTVRPQNTINNWRSALLQYREFFFFFTEEAEEEEAKNVEIETEEVDAVVNIEVVKKEILSSNMPTVEVPKKSRTRTYKYPVKDLMKNFRFRIITQDRFYGDIFFPISYLKRLLYQKNEIEYFNKWIEEQLNDISIFCETETHKFRDITELTIKTSKEVKEVYITVNKEQKLIYSPNSSGTSIIPFASANLKSIAIDHVNSMKNILIDNIHHLPQLQLITAQLKIIAGNKATAKKYKAAGSVLFSTSSNIDISLLKSELDLIKSHTKFQLMDKVENIRKGAN